MNSKKRPFLCYLGLHSWSQWRNPVVSKSSFDALLGKGIQWARCLRCNRFITRPVELLDLSVDETAAYTVWANTLAQESGDAQD